MKRLITAGAFAMAFAVAAHAQDSTVTSKTKVDGDDAKATVMTGCLSRNADGSFSLTGVTAAAGDDLTAKSKVKTDVDSDDTSVETRTATKVDNDDHAVGTSGAVSSFMLSPRAGVDLAAHVNQRVEVSAIQVDAASGGDDDADVTIKERTKVEADDAPDAKVKSKTEAELPRGAAPRLTALSVKTIAQSCSN